MENKKAKEGGVYKMEEKEIKKLNRRNYFNSISYYNNCASNPCRSKHCNVNRRKWDTNSSTKC